MSKIMFFFLSIFWALNTHAQIILKKDTDKNKYYLFDKEKNDNITKPIYDEILCDPENVIGAVMVKGNKYGIWHFSEKKIEILPIDYEEIRRLYEGVFLVKKDGKFATITTNNNIYYNTKDREDQLVKNAPVFQSEFVFTNALVIDSVDYFGTKQKVKKDPIVFLYKENGDCILYRSSEKKINGDEKSYRFDAIKPVYMNEQNKLIVRYNNKYGLLHEFGYFIHEMIYDSLFPVNGCEYLSDGKDKYCMDEVVTKQYGRLMLQRDKPNKPLEVKTIEMEKGKPTVIYGLVNNYFLDQKDVEIIERIKVGENFGYGPSRVHLLIIKKNNLYGIAAPLKIIVEPNFPSYEKLICNTSSKEVSYIVFKKDKSYYIYDIFKNLNASPKLTPEAYIDYRCAGSALTIQKENGKWYFYNVNGISSTQTAYDLITTEHLGLPTGYIGNKIYLNAGSKNIEIQVPEGSRFSRYIEDTKGLVYIKKGKYGYMSPTANIDPILPSFFITGDYDGKLMFGTQIDSAEFIFYPSDIGANNRIKTAVDCQVCEGRGYTYKDTKTQEVVKGKIRTYKQRTHLWRDGITYTTTTEKEPDRVITHTETEHIKCTACLGSKLQSIYLSYINGKLVIGNQ